MSSVPFGSKQKSSKNKEIQRNKQKEEKDLPKPQLWRKSALSDPQTYSPAKWKELGRAGQEQYIQDSRPKPHRFLSLCYPQRFPSNFPEAWDSLKDDGTTKAI